MLLLVSTSDKLQVVTGSAGAIDVHASWMDNVAGSVVPGRTNTSITLSATTDVVASPAASTQRNIKTLHIRNRGGAPNLITVQHTDGATLVQLYQTTLQPEQTLQYIDEIGFILPTTGSGSFLTGDVKLTMKIAADPGWVIMNDGSIGNPSSGATSRANADTQALFALLWTNITALVVQDNTGATVVRSATAAADYGANRRLVLPAILGRALAGAGGAGVGLTARALGSAVGEENHYLSIPEMPSHGHSVNDPGHTHDVLGNPDNSLILCASLGGSVLASGADQPYNNIHAHALPVATGISIGLNGGGAPHNTMQPTSFLTVMIKL